MIGSTPVARRAGRWLAATATTTIAAPATTETANQLPTTLCSSSESRRPVKWSVAGDVVYVSFTAVPLALTISIPACAPSTS